MKIRYVFDIQGLTIFSDCNLMGIEGELFDSFIGEMEELEGIDTISMSRYKLEISVGLLFSLEQIKDEIKDIMSIYFPGSAGNWLPIGVADIKLRSDEVDKLKANVISDATKIVTSFNSPLREA